MAQASANISKKRKHVAEGVFKAELDGYLRKVSFQDILVIILSLHLSICLFTIFY